MIKFRCPACQSMLQAAPECVGALVACPCGNQLTVPVAAVAASGQAAETPAPTSIVLVCSCGTQLRAPASAYGKAVRCPCGNLVMVNETSSADWTDRLPEVTASAYVPPSITHAAAPQAGPEYWETPVASYQKSSTKQIVALDAQEIADSYLNTAERQLHEQWKHKRDLASESYSGTRWLLVTIGVLTISFTILQIIFLNHFVVTDPAVTNASTVKTIVTIFLIANIGLGMLYIGLGILVPWFPLLAPLTALILFGLGTLLMAFGGSGQWLSPTWIITMAVRLVFLGALAKSLNDGAYYR